MFINMKKLIYFILVFFTSVAFAAQPALTIFQGGTGTTSPSGILIGDNGSTPRLQTLTIGSNLTLTGTTLSATGGGGSPGGLTTQIQFNDNGNFGGDGNLVWDAAGFGLALRSNHQNFTLFSADSPSTNGTYMFATNDGQLFIGAVVGSGGITFDFNTAVSEPTLIFPNAAGTFALGTGSAGNCASWSTTNTLTTTGSPCGAGGGTGVGTVSTSSLETAGQIPYWTTTSGYPAKLGGIATGTVSAGSTAITVTANRYVLNGALAIDCAGASGAQVGCLSAANFLTFSNKIGTSSNATAGNLAYYTTTSGTPALIADVATGTLSVSGALTTNATRSVVGGALAITYTGLATTSQPSSSNLLTSNGAAGVYGTATSTLSASSPLTGSFVQVGSGGSLGCQTASGAQAGCLSAADWLTFNG